ncbi:response regulator [Thermodesulfobacterium sp. TA1]|uniref:response regulator n=1 Tax=Thermodesulfobacterium sp. TA1 TaxID=2234087 RepID=UPI0012323718|nr:response regulator [Thermodesulfobacterium sp. TA1]QER42687.1 response regulator [Thermodesulfobacterium sp. TA1]
MKIKPKVLIIDDEVDFGETLAERLELRDFESRFTESIEEALALLEQNWIPDIILLDLKMPKIDGIKGIEILRKVAPYASILMITGHGSVSVAIESMKKGICDYLFKPIELEELISKINECLKNKKD